MQDYGGYGGYSPGYRDPLSYGGMAWAGATTSSARCRFRACPRRSAGEHVATGTPPHLVSVSLINRCSFPYPILTRESL